MWLFNRRCESRHIHRFVTFNRYSGANRREEAQALRCQDRRDHKGTHWSYYFHERNVAEWEDA